MKIGVIGNSHSVALMLAARQAPPSGGWSFDFYALPGGNAPELMYRDGRLHPASEARVHTNVGGAAKRGLELAPYDAVVVSACGLWAARQNASHPLSALGCADWLADGSGVWPKGVQLVSTAVFDAVAETQLRQHASVQFAGLLAGVFNGPVVLQPIPPPSRALREDADWYPNVRYGERGWRAWRQFHAAQYRAVQRSAAELGAAVALLPFPVDCEDGFMDPLLCDPADPWHANALYGALVLQQVRRHLGAGH